jgi:hypothetical protein
MRPTTQAIEAAEELVRLEIDAVAQALTELHERAKALSDDARRLTALRSEGERLERSIRCGLDQWAGLTRGREPDPERGEAVDAELVGRIVEARGAA